METHAPSPAPAGTYGLNLPYLGMETYCHSDSLLSNCWLNLPYLGMETVDCVGLVHNDEVPQSSLFRNGNCSG